MVMTRYGGLSKTHWQKYRRGYALETKLGGNSMEMDAQRDANWNVRDPLGLRFDPSCVLYLPLYKLDGASFMSKDAYGHLATVTGALWGPQGHSFDGIDNGIDLGNPTALQLTGDWTLWSWVNPTTVPDTFTRAIISKDGEAGDRGWYLQIASITGQVIALCSSNGTDTPNFTTTAALTAGIWTLTIAVHIGSSLKVYFNNVDQAGTLVGTPSVQYDSSTNAYIGRKAAGVFYKGVNGETGVLNKGLSQSEITNLYLATKWRYS